MARQWRQRGRPAGLLAAGRADRAPAAQPDQRGPLSGRQRRLVPGTRLPSALRPQSGGRSRAAPAHPGARRRARAAAPRPRHPAAGGGRAARRRAAQERVQRRQDRGGGGGGARKARPVAAAAQRRRRGLPAALHGAEQRLCVGQLLHGGGPLRPRAAAVPRRPSDGGAAARRDPVRLFRGAIRGAVRAGRPLHRAAALCRGVHGRGGRPDQRRRV
mmetsp:Transcript_42674/g.137790  ORF Transcript_42674/g.137790 Transcript_42674/m.137790 type:complete len:216 (+) Transcript_42674:273-920(+)